MMKHLQPLIYLFLSLLALVISVAGKAGWIPTQNPHDDLKWITTFVLSLLVPLWGIYISLKYETTEHIKKINDDIKKTNDRIDSALALGTITFVGRANDAALSVIESIQLSKEITNTYIVSEGEPYDPKTAQALEDALYEFIKRYGRLHEIVSVLGKTRVDRLKTRLGAIPAHYKVRVIKDPPGEFPACNFIILERKKADPFKKEIFFGWGYFRWDQNQSVFRSSDDELIRFFEGYHKAFNHVSEVYLGQSP
jgi:hypothetical protein